MVPQTQQDTSTPRWLWSQLSTQRLGRDWRNNEGTLHRFPCILGRSRHVSVYWYVPSQVCPWNRRDVAKKVCRCSFGVNAPCGEGRRLVIWHGIGMYWVCVAHRCITFNGAMNEGDLLHWSCDHGRDLYQLQKLGVEGWLWASWYGAVLCKYWTFGRAEKPSCLDALGEVGLFGWCCPNRGDFVLIHLYLFCRVSRCSNQWPRWSLQTFSVLSDSFQGVKCVL